MHMLKSAQVNKMRIKTMQQTSSEFGSEIRECLTQFKQVFRSNPQKLRSAIDIEKLQIKRRQLRHYNDTQLYQVVVELIHNLEKIVQDKNMCLYEHKGLSSFIEKLQSTLREYTIQNQSVIHIGKYSVRIHLNLVQDLALLQHQYQAEIEQRVIRHLRILYRLSHAPTLEKIRMHMENIKTAMPHIYKKLLNITASANLRSA